LLPDLEALLAAGSTGDRLSPLRWTCKSIRRLAADLHDKGHRVGPRKLAELLQQLHFRLQQRQGPHEGLTHPERSAQFAYLNDLARLYLHSGNMVVSVAARQLRGKAALTDDEAPATWSPIDPDPNTVALAALALRRWWQDLAWHSGLPDVLVLIETGPKNLAYSRSWQLALQDWADETHLRLFVCYFPPGTTQWRKIDHRLGVPLLRAEIPLDPGTTQWRKIDHRLVLQSTQHSPGYFSLRHEVVIQQVGDPSQKTAPPPEGRSPPPRPAIPPTDPALACLCIQPADFHGEWNYLVLPRVDWSPPGAGYQV
jgi:hypothetical protein